MERNTISSVLTLACLSSLTLGATSHARTLYVSNTAPADFNTIQAAIDDANDGDIILVAPGTYTGDGNRDIDFKGKAVALRSEAGPESCTIQCDGRPRVFSGPPEWTWIDAEYHRGFHFHSGEDVNSVVEGFTVTQGYMGPYAGGGVYCEDSSPTLRDCIITRNVACGGGGIATWRSDIRVDNCVIAENAASWTWADVGGGISVSRGNAHVFNCLIAANTATGSGGGMSCEQGNHEIVNCSIVGNRAGRGYPRAGGGIIFGASRNNNVSCLRNSIVWGNTAGSYGDEIALWDTAPILGMMQAQIEYSLVGDDPNDLFNQAHQDRRVQGRWIVGDPLFVAPGSWDPNSTPDDLSDDVWVDGDYHLKSQGGHWEASSQSWVVDDVTSPCIDAGDPNSPIGEEPFPNGGRVNMGAYGGTAEASKSYFGEHPCSTLVPGDIDGDCRVNLSDLSILVSHWLDRAEHRRVTTTCRFINSRSSMTATSRVSSSHHVEGVFRLTIDWATRAAVFEQVNATIEGVSGPASNLATFFSMTQLVSTSVTNSSVEFAFHKNIPRFPGADVQLTVTFRDGLVHLTGGFTGPVYDGASYRLDAAAVPVDDPRSSPSIARVLETIIAGDVNNDRQVDFADWADMASHWRIHLNVRR